MRTVQKENLLLVQGVLHFDLEKTLLCGQCFRWEQKQDGFWEGIASGKFLRIKQQNRTLLLQGTDKETFLSFWRGYFALDEEYEALVHLFSGDPLLKKAVAYSRGIRVLRQDFWETLCSFILSQNNNIPRIKKIIAALCEHFGEQTPHGFLFPSAEVLSRLRVEDLAVIRCGFRAKYLLDAAKKVASGELSGEKLAALSTEQAKTELMRIHGVGPKVADCVLLYGCGRNESVPLDVWMKRAMAHFYPNGLPDFLQPVGGILQQFLFFYAKEHPALFRDFSS